MNALSELQAQCLKLIAELNSTHPWGLSAEQQQQYAQAIAQHVDEDIGDDQLRRIIGYYHLDHEHVAALQQPQHPTYEQIWSEWMSQTIPILRKNGLTWTTTESIEFEDLAQTALLALVSAIPSFHYNSRFSTWAYRVVVQSVLGYLRTQRALKRPKNNESLDRIGDPGIAIELAQRPEDLAASRVLTDHVNTILGSNPNQRLRTVFLLWAKYDMQTEEIAKLIHLSPSRVRDLLRQARKELRSHPDLGDWLDNKDDDPGDQ